MDVTPESSMQQVLGQLARRATTALNPTASAALVIVFVVWVLVRPFLPLSGALASVVDTATVLIVLLAAILIEAGREATLGNSSRDPRASGRHPAG